MNVNRPFSTRSENLFIEMYFSVMCNIHISAVLFSTQSDIQPVCVGGGGEKTEKRRERSDKGGGSLLFIKVVHVLKKQTKKNIEYKLYQFSPALPF